MINSASGIKPVTEENIDNWFVVGQEKVGRIIFCKVLNTVLGTQLMWKEPVQEW